MSSKSITKRRIESLTNQEVEKELEKVELNIRGVQIYNIYLIKVAQAEKQTLEEVW